MTKKIEKILIANRGEIAARVMRTAHAMGIATVAVYHHAERKAVHCAQGGEAHEITGETPVAAYLDADQIIALAQSTGAEAIHPGYGFLSENADFARKVAAAGLIFIGPDADSIQLMGDKIRSREFAALHDVPVAPSVEASDDIDTFIAAAESIGFPLLIKASAGGGGKGMNIVHKREELSDAAQLAAGEAERYFGDKRIYAERYVETPRHIEVQVMGDGNGKVLHFFERECSIQRRYQKVIEEAPAANLDPALRDKICGAALRLAKAANYKNAGTVEFILAPDGAFYFLEMNTRLQVEHPVTEMTTGIDLVRLQIDIAAGQPLSLEQEDLRQDGHAIECRICAEVPEADFRPATGRVLQLSTPLADHIRFESGISEGSAVTLDFDSMLAKLVVHGPNRQEATERTAAALQELVLLGVESNIDYLARILNHAEFRAGNLDTGFINRWAPDLSAPELDDETRAQVIAAALLAFREFRDLALESPRPYADMGAWRN